MRHKLINDWLPTILTFFMIASAAFPFLTVYELYEHQIIFIGTLALFCLITRLITIHSLTFFLYLLFYFVVLYVYFPFNRSLSFAWGQTYLNEISIFWQNHSMNQNIFLPTVIALPFFLLLMLSLIFLLIRYEMLGFGYVFLCIYILMLAVFNQLNLGKSIITLTFTALIFLSWKQNNKRTNQITGIQHVFLSIIILIFLVVVSYYSLTTIHGIRNTVVTHTFPLRNYLTQHGFYEKLTLPNSSAKTGFSTDDSLLGGPIQEDKTPIFKTRQSEKSYWRVETKSNYNGKGWDDTTQVNDKKMNKPLSSTTAMTYTGNFTPKETVTLIFLEDISHLPLPYGTVNGDFMVNTQESSADIQNQTTLSDFKKELTFDWQRPLFTKEELIQVPYKSTTDSLNTQLPTSLPERIQQLANHLTAEKQTLYEKVVAIENYLKNDKNFLYSKSDTPYTPEEEDYVDYFLFDSKIGYCDNFSSAMVVLLRSIGIESRWTKGYSSGEMMDADHYIIRKNNAHSWVEVYFTGYGWIPFEPTPGFDTTSLDTPEKKQAKTEQSQTNDSSQEIQSTQNTTEVQKTKELKIDKPKLTPPPISKTSTILIVLGGSSIILCIFLIYYLSKQFFWFKIFIYHKIYPLSIEKPYQILLKKANSLLKRPTNESLSMYAKRLEDDYPTLNTQFSQLTQLYEANFYGKKQLNTEEISLLLTTAKLFLKFKKKKTKLS